MQSEHHSITVGTLRNYVFAPEPSSDAALDKLFSGALFVVSDLELGQHMVAGERRSEPRRSLSDQPAWILTDGDPTPITVAIKNVSKSGANLHVSSDVPKEFTLFLTADGQVQRRCRRIWQSNGSVGVSVIPGARKTVTAPPAVLID